jgi:hypothetical protein
MNIHSLFILRLSGVCIYSRNFTDEYKFDINLITPFFSAIISFSEKVISKKLEVLEMGNLRFLFNMQKNFIFIILSDSTASLLFVSTRLTQISGIFFKIFASNQIPEYQQIKNLEFDDTVDSIITGEEEIHRSKAFYKKLIDLFQKLLFENEIIGAATLSIKGNIIYSSLPNDVLIQSLKELEIRFMTGASSLPEMFYSMENGQKVFSKTIKLDWKLESLMIVVLFEKNVPLGMAELNLNKIVKTVQNLM